MADYCLMRSILLSTFKLRVQVEGELFWQEQGLSNLEVPLSDLSFFDISWVEFKVNKNQTAFMFPVIFMANYQFSIVRQTPSGKNIIYLLIFGTVQDHFLFICFLFDLFLILFIISNLGICFFISGFI